VLDLLNKLKVDLEGMAYFIQAEIDRIDEMLLVATPTTVAALTDVKARMEDMRDYTMEKNNAGNVIGGKVNDAMDRIKDVEDQLFLLHGKHLKAECAEVKTDSQDRYEEMFAQDGISGEIDVILNQIDIETGNYYENKCLFDEALDMMTQLNAWLNGKATFVQDSMDTIDVYVTQTSDATLIAKLLGMKADMKVDRDDIRQKNFAGTQIIGGLMKNVLDKVEENEKELYLLEARHLGPEVTKVRDEAEDVMISMLSTALGDEGELTLLLDSVDFDTQTYYHNKKVLDEVRDELLILYAQLGGKADFIEGAIVTVDSAILYATDYAVINELYTIKAGMETNLHDVKIVDAAEEVIGGWMQDLLDKVKEVEWTLYVLESKHLEPETEKAKNDSETMYDDALGATGDITDLISDADLATDYYEKKKRLDDAKDKLTELYAELEGKAVFIEGAMETVSSAIFYTGDYTIQAELAAIYTTMALYLSVIKEENNAGDVIGGRMKDVLDKIDEVDVKLYVLEAEALEPKTEEARDDAQTLYQDMLGDITALLERVDVEAKDYYTNKALADGAKELLLTLYSGLEAKATFIEGAMETVDSAIMFTGDYTIQTYLSGIYTTMAAYLSEVKIENAAGDVIGGRMGDVLNKVTEVNDLLYVLESMHLEKLSEEARDDVNDRFDRALGAGGSIAVVLDKVDLDNKDYYENKRLLDDAKLLLDSLLAEMEGKAVFIEGSLETVDTAILFAASFTTQAILGGLYTTIESYLDDVRMKNTAGDIIGGKMKVVLDVIADVDEQLYLLEAKTLEPRTATARDDAQELVDDAIAAGGKVAGLIGLVDLQAKDYYENKKLLDDAKKLLIDLYAELEGKAAFIEGAIDIVDAAINGTSDPSLIAELVGVYTTIESHLADVKVETVNGDIAGGMMKTVLDTTQEVEDTLYVLEAQHLVVEALKAKDEADTIYQEVNEDVMALIALVDVETKDYYENKGLLDRAKDMMNDLFAELEAKASFIEGAMDTVDSAIMLTGNYTIQAELTGIYTTMQSYFVLVKVENAAGDIIGGLMKDSIDGIKVIDDNLYVLEAEHLKVKALEAKDDAQALIDVAIGAGGAVTQLIDAVDVETKGYYENKRLLDDARKLLLSLSAEINGKIMFIEGAMETIDSAILLTGDYTVQAQLSAAYSTIDSYLVAVKVEGPLGDIIGGAMKDIEDVMRGVEENLYLIAAQHLEKESEDAKDYALEIFGDALDDGGAIKSIIDNVDREIKDYYENKRLLDEARRLLIELYAEITGEGAFIEAAMETVDSAILLTGNYTIQAELTGIYTTMSAYLSVIKEENNLGDITGGLIKDVLDKKKEVEDTLYVLEAEYLLVESEDAMNDGTQIFDDNLGASGTIKILIDAVDVEGKDYYENNRLLDDAMKLLLELSVDLEGEASFIEGAMQTVDSAILLTGDYTIQAELMSIYTTMTSYLAVVKQENGAGDITGGLIKDLMDTIEEVQDTLHVLEAKHLVEETEDERDNAQALYDDALDIGGNIKTLIDGVDLDTKDYYENKRLLDDAKKLLLELYAELEGKVTFIEAAMDTVDSSILLTGDYTIQAELAGIYTTMESHLKVVKLESISGDIVGGLTKDVLDTLKDVEDQLYLLEAQYLEKSTEDAKDDAEVMYDDTLAAGGTVKTLIDGVDIEGKDYYENKRLLDDAKELLLELYSELQGKAQFIESSMETVDTAILLAGNYTIQAKLTDIYTTMESYLNIVKQESAAADITGGLMKDVLDKIDEVEGKLYLLESKHLVVECGQIMNEGQGLYDGILGASGPLYLLLGASGIIDYLGVSDLDVAALDYYLNKNKLSDAKDILNDLYLEIGEKAGLIEAALDTVTSAIYAATDPALMPIQEHVEIMDYLAPFKATLTSGDGWMEEIDGIVESIEQGLKILKSYHFRTLAEAAKEDSKDLYQDKLLDVLDERRGKILELLDYVDVEENGYFENKIYLTKAKDMLEDLNVELEDKAEYLEGILDTINSTLALTSDADIQFFYSGAYTYIRNMCLSEVKEVNSSGDIVGGWMKDTIDKLAEVEHLLDIVEADHMEVKAEQARDEAGQMYLKYLDTTPGTPGSLLVLLAGVNVVGGNYYWNKKILDDVKKSLDDLYIELGRRASTIEGAIETVDSALLSATDTDVLAHLTGVYTTMNAYLTEVKDENSSGTIIGGWMRNVLDKTAEVNDMIYIVEAEFIEDQCLTAVTKSVARYNTALDAGGVIDLLLTAAGTETDYYMKKKMFEDAMSMLEELTVRLERTKTFIQGSYTIVDNMAAAASAAVQPQVLDRRNDIGGYIDQLTNGTTGKITLVADKIVEVADSLYVLEAEHEKDLSEASRDKAVSMYRYMMAFLEAAEQ